MNFCLFVKPTSFKCKEIKQWAIWIETMFLFFLIHSFTSSLSSYFPYLLLSSPYSHTQVSSSHLFSFSFICLFVKPTSFKCKEIKQWAIWIETMFLFFLIHSFTSSLSSYFPYLLLSSPYSHAQVSSSYLFSFSFTFLCTKPHAHMSLSHSLSLLHIFHLSKTLPN